MFQAAAYTDIGPRKKSNQDSCCVEVVMTPYGHVALLAVCDGVGGLASGELASSSVIRWLVTWFRDSFLHRMNELVASRQDLFSRIQYEWNIGLDEMNDAILRYGNETQEKLGTTCTAVFLFGGRYLIAHVGDSRVYRFAEGGMQILTKDQTWVAQEVARGNISPEKARFHPKRNIILQAVGTQPDLQTVFSEGSYEEGDTFMVCCDGFRNELFDDELIDAFGHLERSTSAQMTKICGDMVQLVLNRGEKDNITVAVVSCQGVAQIGVDAGDVAPSPELAIPTAPLSDGGADGNADASLQHGVRG